MSTAQRIKFSGSLTNGKEAETQLVDVLAGEGAPTPTKGWAKWAKPPTSCSRVDRRATALPRSAARRSSRGIGRWAYTLSSSRPRRCTLPLILVSGPQVWRPPYTVYKCCSTRATRPRSRSVASLLPKKKKRWKGHCFQAGHQASGTSSFPKAVSQTRKSLHRSLISPADTNWPRAPGY